MDDLSRFCCLNSQCPDHGKRGAGNLSVTSRYGPEKVRCMLRCRTCKARFSERKGTVFFGDWLSREKVEAVLEHVAEGCGVRQTGRLCKVNRNTVGRYSRLAGEHARDLHDELVVLSPLTRKVQFDEKWAFVAKKEKNCDPTDPADDHKGDTWDHVAFDPESRLVVSVVPGERSAANVAAVVQDFRRRTGGRVMNLITTDGYSAYEEAILDAYGETVTPPRTGKRGRPKAAYKVAPKDLNYAVVEKTREKGRVVKIVTRVVFGTMATVMAALGMSRMSKAINTAFVERENGTDRHRNARKVRKTYRFSKNWRYHEAVTYLTFYVYNFCWPVRTLWVKRRSGALADAEPGDGGGTGGSRLVNLRMAVVLSRATLLARASSLLGLFLRRDRRQRDHDLHALQDRPV